LTTWETPQSLFDALYREFHFTIDVAANTENHKCVRYFTVETDALRQNWSHDVFWLNPPYGRGQNVYAWVKKVYESAVAGGVGACLLPASTDTKWFHEFCMKASEIRFVSDRLWFSLDGRAQRANHASIVVVFRQNDLGTPRISSIKNYRPPRQKLFARTA
jgi:site-specific DNA-methyltransferase (adenine-specific)